MTRWIPNTCKCDIEYTDDGNFIINKINNLCKLHSSVKVGDSHNAILLHNTTNNKLTKSSIKTLKEST